MSTSNFRKPNLSKVFAIALNDESQEGAEFAVANVEEALATIPGFKATDGWMDSTRRQLGYIPVRMYDNESREWLVPDLYITIESGYYTGAMIDASFMEMDGIVFTNAAEKRVKQVMARIEKALKPVTTQMVRIATFSNGEAVYKAA